MSAVTYNPHLTPAPEGGYVAHDPATGTTTQGDTTAEALANLREAVELYLEEFPFAANRASWTPLFLTV